MEDERSAHLGLDLVGGENQTKWKTILKSDRILVDAGYFYGIFDKSDQYHSDANKIDIEELRNRPYLCLFVLAWPMLYETVNTRFVKRGQLSKLEEPLVPDRTQSRVTSAQPTGARARRQVNIRSYQILSVLC